eukprot:jgi/Astpho2/3624/Aster-x1160
MTLSAILLAALLSSWATAQIKLQLAPGNSCLEPSLVKGYFHIVIAGYRYDTCFDTWLWDLGTTNADVTLYRRMQPDLPERSWAGPCGMSVMERLLVPNHGKDGAVFYDFILEHYDNMPSYIMFVHGHGPSGRRAWHTSCESTISRTRLYYSLLATPVLGFKDGETELVHRGITLSSQRNGSERCWPGNKTSCFPASATGLIGAGRITSVPVGINEEGQDLVPHVVHQRPMQTSSREAGAFSTRGLLLSDIRDLPAEHQVSAQEENTRATTLCDSIFYKYNVMRITVNWHSGFHSCCASFVAPTANLLRLPKLFFKDMRDIALALDNEFITTRDCFEFKIWRLFDESPMNNATRWFYRTAADQARNLNLDRCRENKCEVGDTE